jgi:hypothetical protein
MKQLLEALGRRGFSLEKVDGAKLRRESRRNGPLMRRMMSEFMDNENGVYPIELGAEIPQHANRGTQDRKPDNLAHVLRQIESGRVRRAFILTLKKPEVVGNYLAAYQAMNGEHAQFLRRHHQGGYVSYHVAMPEKRESRTGLKAVPDEDQYMRVYVFDARPRLHERVLNGLRNLVRRADSRKGDAKG